MTKTKKNGLLLTLTAFMLAMISAALLFMIAPRRPAKADSETLDLTGWAVEDFTVGTKMAGIYLYLYSGFENNEGLLSMGTAESWYFEQSFTDSGFNHFTVYYNQIDMQNLEPINIERSQLVALGLNPDGAVYYLPETLINATQELNELWSSFEAETIFSGMGFVGEQFYDTFENITQKVLNAPVGQPTEPDTPDNPSEPDTPGDDERITPLPNVTESKFNLGEWLTQAGDDVSAWLGENVGIATTGSTVLIVGAIIIIIMLARRRRR